MTGAASPARTGRAIGSVRDWRPVLWLRRHPQAADGILAAVVMVPVLASLDHLDVTPGTQPVDWRAYLLSAIAVGCIAFRRRWSFAALIVCGVSVDVYYAIGFPDGALVFAVLILTYSVAAHTPRRVSLPALGIVLVGVAVAIFSSPEGSGESVGDFAGNIVFFVAAWVLGDNLQIRRQYVSELEEKADRLEREQEQEARRAVLGERARIAREMHDIVAHHVSVMVVQAGAARTVVGADPDRAAEAMAAIETTGREALTEMRRTVGVLRGGRGDGDDDRGDDSGSLAPQPDDSQLESLVAQMAAAGLTVTLETEGTRNADDPALGLTVYRIVQEALTNALKHAGPARVEVRVRYSPRTVDIEVVDDGRGAAAPTGPGGEGLIGMRERIALFGGDLVAGPQAGGGFRLRAAIPLEPPEDGR
jgi:signal transduction histidine kinase